MDPSMAMGRVIDCGCLRDLFWELAVAVGRSSMAMSRGSEMPEEVARRRVRNWSLMGAWNVRRQGVTLEEMFEKVACGAGMGSGGEGSFRPAAVINNYAP